MKIDEAILKTKEIMYEDVTEEFCKICNLSTKETFVGRFFCPVTSRSIQVSFAMKERTAMFSGEESTILLPSERAWIKDFYKSNVNRKVSKFDVIYFDKAL